MYPKELKAETQTAIRTRMLIVALFTIVKVEAVRVATNRWTDKQNGAYACHDILFSHKKGVSF